MTRFRIGIGGSSVGWRDWLNRLFGRRSRGDLVRYYDFESGQVVRIPRRELVPGVVEARVDGCDGVVWVSPDQLTGGPIQHPPFDDDVRKYVRRIQEAFAEHRKLSVDEWEEGFRRDTNAEREIAIWHYAAEVYTSFAEKDPSAGRRLDYYRCVLACLTTGPDTVWDVLEPEVISKSDAEKVIAKFFGPDR